MPQFLSNVNDNTLTFRTAEGLAYAAADSWGSSPEALGWNQGMRWGTALMFIDFAAALQTVMPEVTYPFLIVHDPEDQVCNIEGGRNLMEQSQTPAEKKKLIEVSNLSCGTYYRPFCFTISILNQHCTRSVDPVSYDAAFFALLKAHGFLHGVLVNETEACCNYALEWMDAMLLL